MAEAKAKEAKNDNEQLHSPLARRLLPEPPTQNTNKEQDRARNVEQTDDGSHKSSSFKHKLEFECDQFKNM